MWKILASVLWTLVVILGSAIPGNSASKLNPFIFAGGDKLAHCGAYALIVFLWSIALSGDKYSKLIFLSSIALGIILEICQSTLFESRSFEIMDIIANIMGSIIGLAVFYKLFKK